MTKPLASELLQKMDAYWRAANYLSVGQIYLWDNPLLKMPLKLKHVKPRPVDGAFEDNLIRLAATITRPPEL